MSERVVIIGSYLCEQFYEGVISNGWDCLLVDYKLEYKKNVLAIIQSKISSKHNLNRYITIQLEKEIVKREKEISVFKPTRIIILRGYDFTPQTFQKLSSFKIPLYLWTYDSINRYPEQIKAIEKFNKIFVIDGGDLEIHPDFVWMPIGYNPKNFYPETEKEYDLVFLGRVNGKLYRTRYTYLKKINSLPIAKKYRFAFMGTTGSFIKDYFLKRELCNMTFIGKQSFKEYSSVIRRSRLCINIHQDDGLKPVNPMFFSIPAAAVCQITDNRDYYSKWLIPNAEFIPISIDMIEECLVGNLENDKKIKEISKEGYKRVIPYYSISEQLKQLFN